MKTKEQREYDVIIIGGGATGVGTARDCALRGLRVLLVERFDYASGATGRNHGLLHSGARYAVNDSESRSASGLSAPNVTGASPVRGSAM